MTIQDLKQEQAALIGNKLVLHKSKDIVELQPSEVVILRRIMKEAGLNVTL